MSQADRQKLMTLIRFRNATLNVVSATGGMSFLHYRRACEEVLKLLLAREPTDEELDDLLCEREPRS